MRNPIKETVINIKVQEYLERGFDEDLCINHVEWTDRDSGHVSEFTHFPPVLIGYTVCLGKDCGISVIIPRR
jgi:hypothetical protein